MSKRGITILLKLERDIVNKQKPYFIYCTSLPQWKQNIVKSGTENSVDQGMWEEWVSWRNLEQENKEGVRILERKSDKERNPSFVFECLALYKQAGSKNKDSENR
jgi:hypothetical protein